MVRKIDFDHFGGVNKLVNKTAKEKSWQNRGKTRA
jgi:hypothetical protein